MRNVIVIGASAGGLPVVKSVVSELPAGIDAAVFIVMHLSRKSNADIIVELLQKQTSLDCVVASNGMPVEKGFLYLAPPDHHLMVRDGSVIVNQGPHENKYRPAIDVLFRSAAVHYGHRTIGIVLTGLMDDGTSGMSAIKRSGGICIVQDPGEAQFPDMPRSVLNNVAVDYKVSQAAIPVVIGKILGEALPRETPIPEELQIEADITEKMMSDMDQMKKIGDRSDFVCPDCGGGLFAVKNDPAHRYRCYTGHVYNETILQEMQDTNIEESIWVSIRMLEEKSNLLKLMAGRTGEDDTSLIRGLQRRNQDVQKHIAALKAFLMRLHKADFDLSSDAPPEKVE